MQRVVIPVGLPGSGKSTWINKAISNLEEGSFSVCSADHFFEKSGKYVFDYSKLGIAHKECMQKFKEAVDAGTEWIYVDNTNVRARDRTYYYNTALDAGCIVLALVFDQNIQLSTDRNVHGVTREIIERMSHSLDLAPGVYIVARKPDGSFTHTRVGDLTDEPTGILEG